MPIKTSSFKARGMNFTLGSAVEYQGQTLIVGHQGRLYTAHTFIDAGAAPDTPEGDEIPDRDLRMRTFFHRTTMAGMRTCAACRAQVQSARHTRHAAEAQPPATIACAQCAQCGQRSSPNAALGCIARALVNKPPIGGGARTNRALHSTCLNRKGHRSNPNANKSAD